MGCACAKSAIGVGNEFTNRLKINTDCRLVLVCSEEFIFYFQNIILKQLFGFSEFILYQPDQVGQIIPTRVSTRLLLKRSEICAHFVDYWPNLVFDKILCLYLNVKLFTKAGILIRILIFFWQNIFWKFFFLNF